MTPSGGFAVVYQDSDLDEVRFDVKMNLFGADGNALQQHDLNTHTDNEQRGPAVAAVGERGFITAWESHGDQDGDGAGVFGRRFLGGNATDISEFCIPFGTENSQHRVAVSASSEIMVVVWQHTGIGMDFQLRALVLPVQ